jgi:hypothetical protein
MNLRQFYETVVFRDLVNHTLPGSVALIGVGMVGGAVVSRLGLNHSLSDALRKIGIFSHNVVIGVTIFIVLAYIAGNALSALFPLTLRNKQSTLAYHALASHPWLQQQVELCLAAYFKVSQRQSHTWLADPETVRMLRETGRELAQKDYPHLYQEFIGRYSVLSIFSLNMAYALIWLLLSAGLAMCVSWPIISTSSYFKSHDTFLIGLSIGVVISTLALARLFLERAFSLRKRMIRHTFEIWLIGYGIDRKAPSVLVPDLEIEGRLASGEGDRVLYRWR